MKCEGRSFKVNQSPSQSIVNDLRDLCFKITLSLHSAIGGNIHTMPKNLDDNRCMKKKDLVICKNLGKLRLSVVQLMHHIL